ncbi:hypothetical protein J4212_07800 [Candidatus Woesearchaeota archaeon]|nr:hypothetical protein [Candidatus Woesearchaeota archaeon]
MGTNLKKKGVSPLIATVLLISFAVALGAVVMNWGRNIDPSQADEKCIGVKIAIDSSSGYDACYRGLDADGLVFFSVENTGSVDLEGLGVWIVGSKSTKFLDFNNIKIKQGQVLNLEKRDEQIVSYDFATYGSIRQMQLIPKIKSEASIDVCPKATVKAENIVRCQSRKT